VATRNVAEVLPEFLEVVAPKSDKYWLDPMRQFAVWLLKWPFGKQQSIVASVRDDLERPEKVKAMVKREVNHKAPSKARLIQFYWNLATQALFGPQFYTMQKTLGHVFRRRHMPGEIDITFASGMTAVEIGEWMGEVLREGAVSFYERDGKNWDSSMQAQHAEFRQAVYRSVDPELANFAKSCDKVKGFAVFPGGVLRYTMNYTVKSGHNDTTLGNSLINAAITYAAMKRLGIPGSILVAGDDLLVAARRPVPLKEMVAAEAEYGITPEARVFDDYERVTFISGMWTSDGDIIGFVPLPGRLFARLWWTVKPPALRKQKAYLRGVARGLLPAAGELPVVGEMLRSFDSYGEEIRSDKGRQFHGSKFSFGEGVYAAFSRRYGVTVDELLDCEAFLRALPAHPLVLKHPVLDRFMSVDMADIAERGDGIW